MAAVQLQLKHGDITEGEWKKIQGQCEQAFYSKNAVHPGFDAKLPAVVVLVLTGRLKGGASGAVDDYRKSVQDRHFGRFDCWDRDRLVEKFSQHLAVSSNARWEEAIFR